MRAAISSRVLSEHPSLEERLWAVAVHAKEADPDIKLMGLHVRACRSPKPGHWNGWAHPREESVLYHRHLIHPAGRIDMRIGINVPEEDIIRLFAHELRHIGQFHRGRKLYGYLTTDPMAEADIEPDCHDFEKFILKKFARARCRGRKGVQSRPDMFAHDNVECLPNTKDSP